MVLFPVCSVFVLGGFECEKSVMNFGWKKVRKNVEKAGKRGKNENFWIFGENLAKSGGFRDF